MRKLLKGLLVFCLSIGIVSVAPQGSNAKTTISDPAKEKATELKSQGLDVQVTEVDGYTIVSGFDSTDLKNAKASKGKGDFEAQGAIYDVNAHQYIYYGYTYVGEVNGWLEVEIINSTSIKIRSYNLTPENHNGTYERVDSVYYSPQTGNPAKLYYNFSFLMKVSYMEQGWVPFRTIYKVYPNGTVTFFNDAEA